MERSNEDESAGEFGFAAEAYRPSVHGSPAPHAEDDPRPWLRRTIETEIIPRLMLAHRPQGIAQPDRSGPDTDVLVRDDVESFTRMVLNDEVEAFGGFVAALRERGIGLEQIYLGLIAPAARRLGAMWEADDCDFAQVTLGLWRLQNLTFELAPQLSATWVARPETPRRALLAAVPGSQHTFGLLMVSEFFRRAGWDVWSDPRASAGDLTALVRSEWFDVIGLSIGMDGHVAPLGSMIRGLRRASRNPAVGIMVGGAILAGRPGLAAEVGADLSAKDAREAVDRADAFVASHALQPSA
jgi:methanogenic corrinoid protein MtbC1